MSVFLLSVKPNPSKGTIPARPANADLAFFELFWPFSPFFTLLTEPLVTPLASPFKDVGGPAERKKAVRNRGLKAKCELKIDLAEFYYISHKMRR